MEKVRRGNLRALLKRDLLALLETLLEACERRHALAAALVGARECSGRLVHCISRELGPCRVTEVGGAAGADEGDGRAQVEGAREHRLTPVDSLLPRRSCRELQPLVTES